MGYIDAISEMIDFRKFHGASEAVFQKFSATELYLKRARKTVAKMMRLQWTQDLDIETLEARGHWATMEELLEVVKFHLPRDEDTVKICKSSPAQVNPSDLPFARKFRGDVKMANVVNPASASTLDEGKALLEEVVTELNLKFKCLKFRGNRPPDLQELVLIQNEHRRLSGFSKVSQFFGLCTLCPAIMVPLLGPRSGWDSMNSDPPSLLEMIQHCLRFVVIWTFQVDNSPRKTVLFLHEPPISTYKI